jgi:hypothetical protein
MARWRTETCACGAPVTFEVLGRDGLDYIKILGCLLRVEEVDRVLAPYTGCIDEYMVEVEEMDTERGVKGRLTLHVYGKRALLPQEADELRNAFADALYMTSTKTLRRLIVDGVFVPPQLVQVSASLWGQGKIFKLRFKK